jgi:hypothetical protein
VSNGDWPQNWKELSEIPSPPKTTRYPVQKGSMSDSVRNMMPGLTKR